MLEFFDKAPENHRRALYFRAVTTLNNSIIGNMQQHIRLITAGNIDPEMSKAGNPIDSIPTIDKFNEEISGENAANFEAFTLWAQGLADTYEEETNNFMLVVGKDPETGLLQNYGEWKVTADTDSMIITKPMFKCIQLHSLRSYFINHLLALSQNPDETAAMLTYRSSVEWRMTAPARIQKDEVYEAIIKQLDLEEHVSVEQMKAGATARAKQDQERFREVADQLIYKLEHLPTYACDTDAQAEAIYNQMPTPNALKFIQAIYGEIGKQEMKICLQIADGYMDNMPNLPILKAIRADMDKEIKNLHKQVHAGSQAEAEIDL